MDDPTPTPTDEPHIVRYYSTKPGHKLLRREKCTCSKGSDHSKYESP